MRLRSLPNFTSPIDLLPIIPSSHNLESSELKTGSFQMKKTKYTEEQILEQ